MKIGTSHLRAFMVAVLALFILSTVGCKATVEHLERWENREGSEEMYKKHLQDPNADEEVRVRALELLVKQWRYSSTYFRDGLLTEMPDKDGRERVVAGALPTIAEGLKAEDETTRVYTRDALYAMAQQVESDANTEAIHTLIKQWLSTEWTENPCRTIGGTRAAQLLNLIGREQGEDVLIGIFDGGDWEKAFCALENTKDVEWRSESTTVASSLLGFWDRGLVPEGPQQRVSFLDQLYTFAALPNVREWAFTKIRDEELSAFDRGILVAFLARSQTEEDVPRYLEMLNNEDLFRWEGARSVTTLKGAEGLKMTLTNLPAESDYAFWDGARRLNGFNQGATSLCGIPAMTEKPEDMRPVLVEQAENGHIYARAISIHCLATLGDDASIAELQRIDAGISRQENVAVPFWSVDGDVALKDLIATSIQTYNDAKAAEAAAAAAAEAEAPDAAEENAGEDNDAAAE